MKFINKEKIKNRSAFVSAMSCANNGRLSFVDWVSDVLVTCGFGHTSCMAQGMVSVLSVQSITDC